MPVRAPESTAPGTIASRDSAASRSVRTSPRPTPFLSREQLFAGIVLIVAIGAALAHAGMFFFYTEDDHYIAARYARNLANGLGLVFNEGEHEWGCTTTLLPFLQALLLQFGIPPLAAAKGIGMASVAACCVLCYFLAAHHGRPILAALGPVVIAAYGPLALWSVGGLETALFAVLVLGALTAATEERRGSRRRLPLSALLLLAATLTRYDAPLYLPAVLLARWDRPIRRQAWWLAFFGIGFLGLWTIHAAYFHALLPNSLLSKVVGIPRRLERGWWYLQDFALEQRWLLGSSAVAATIAMIRPGPHQSVTRGLVLALVLSLLYPVWTGGDWMPDHRFFAPVVLFAAPLLVIAAGLLLSLLPQGRLLPASGACIAILVLAAQTVRSDDRWVPRLYHLRTSNDAFLRVGELIPGGDPTLVYALADIGGFGWTSNARILDLAGLTDHEIAGAPHSSSGPLPRKVLEARRPEVILVKLDSPNDIALRRAADSAMVALDTRQLTVRETSALLASAHSAADFDAGSFAQEDGHYRVVNVTRFLEMDQYYVILAREEAIWRLSSTLRTVRLNGGIAYYESGQRERGLAMLTEELDANPYDALGLFPQSMRLNTAHDFATSVRLLRRRLEFVPEDVTALINLGYALGSLNRFDEAVAPLQEALRLAPGNVFASQDLAWVRSEAQQHWDAAPGSDLPDWLAPVGPAVLGDTGTE